ncbi:MAG: hypothetical protein AABZ85_10265 [Thermodesulfobacteriota bacterium]
MVQDFADTSPPKRNGNAWSPTRISFRRSWPESRNASRNANASEIGAVGTDRKEVIQMTDKKQNACGCGCLPPMEKGSNTPKQEVKKPKK